ncbi:MAG: S24/S26 family peptidase [archaeon GBS-70-058]|nr:S24/S26 family peptidase [Candidatus Culexarchaeum nevadense]
MKQILLRLLLVTLLLTPLIGRVLILPATIILYTGSSMKPTIDCGDLIVCISRDYLKYDVGDIVVCTIEPIQYIAHRIIELRGDSIVMKGDNMQLPDPPIDKNYIKYVVTAIIPLKLWFPITVAIAILYMALRCGKIVANVRGGKDFEVIIFEASILISIAVISLTPINSTPIQSTIVRPSVNLMEVKILSVSEVMVRYSIQYAYPINVEECLFKIANETIYSKACISDDHTVIVETPLEIYQLAYKKGIEDINFKLKVKFDKGTLEGNYTYKINWRKLNIYVEGEELIIENPNYVSMNISLIKVIYMTIDKAGFTKILRIDYIEPLTVNALSKQVLKIRRESEAINAYVELKYELLEEEVFERKYIKFTG